MDNILVEEEQISMLGKMLYYSANHLNKREREIYDQLVDNLLRKVSQHRQHNQAHEKMGAPKVLSARVEAKRKAIRNLRPEEVCRTFVDAWNKQDFEIEFFCMSSSFPISKKKSNDVGEYVYHRMNKYQDRHTVGPATKRLIEVSSSETHGNKTSVYCVEVHKMPDHTLTMHRQYELIFEDSAWRIVNFATIKTHESDRVLARKTLE